MTQISSADGWWLTAVCNVMAGFLRISTIPAV